MKSFILRFTQIAQELGLSKSQIRNVKKRGNEHDNDVLDAPCFGHPTKIKKQRERGFRGNPWMRILGLLFERSPTLLMLGLVILQLIRFFAILVFILRFVRRNHSKDLDKRKSLRTLNREDNNAICSNGKEWWSLIIVAMCSCHGHLSHQISFHLRICKHF